MILNSRQVIRLASVAAACALLAVANLACEGMKARGLESRSESLGAKGASGSVIPPATGGPGVFDGIGTGEILPHGADYRDIWTPYDGPTGMTCARFNKAGTLPWKTKGGDYNATPAATLKIKPTVGGVLEFDATSILRAEGFAIKAGSPTVFSSREGASAPRLVVKRADGQSVTLTPFADSAISCSTTNSIGMNTTLQVQSGQVVMIFFPPLPTDAIQATLQLTVVDTYSYTTTPTYTLHAVEIPRQPVRPIEHGIAQAYPNDAGIKSDPAVFEASGFDDANSWGGIACKVLEPFRAGFVPLIGNASETHIKADGLSGCNAPSYSLVKDHGEQHELFVRYYLRFGSDFRDSLDGGKLPGIDAMYYNDAYKNGWYPLCGNGGVSCQGGLKGWSMRGGFSMVSDKENPVYPRVQTHWYAYVADQGATYGYMIPWGSPSLMELSRWYSVEQYIKVNDPGVRNGIVRVWIDGRLTLERTDMIYRGTPPYDQYVTGELLIRRFWPNMHYGGKNPPGVPHTFWIDNVVIAKKYIGPMKRVP